MFAVLQLDQKKACGGFKIYIFGCNTLKAICEQPVCSRARQRTWGQMNCWPCRCQLTSTWCPSVGQVTSTYFIVCQETTVSRSSQPKPVQHSTRLRAVTRYPHFSSVWKTCWGPTEVCVTFSEFSQMTWPPLDLTATGYSVVSNTSEVLKV